MSKTKALFIADTRSLYFNIRNRWPNHSLNYLDLIKKLEEQYNLAFTFKFAYGKYEPEKCFRFKTLLVETGFKVFFERKFYDVELALNAATVMPHVDAVVLASCWHGHFNVLEYAKQNGKFPYLIGVGNPRFVHYYCTPIEITEDLLRKKVDDTEVPEEASAAT